MDSMVESKSPDLRPQTDPSVVAELIVAGRTAKAIGADNRYIRKLIMVQTLVFGLIGYGIAKSGILFDFRPVIKIGFCIITGLIAQAGAVFAMRRIAKLEPASVFRA